MSCAKVGSVMGAAETIGEGDPVGVDAGAVLSDGGAVVALDVGGGGVQAVKSTSSAATMKVRGIRIMYSVCDGKLCQRVSDARTEGVQAT